VDEYCWTAQALADGVPIPECSATDCVAVDILDQVLVSIGEPVIACTTNADEAEVTLTATASGGAGSYTYTWYEGATELGTGNPLVYNFPEGLHTVRVVACDSRGCCDEGEKTFTVLPKVTVNLAVGDPECTTDADEAEVTLTATASGGDETFTYAWFEWNGVDWVPIGTTNPLVRNFPVGDHTVKAVATDGRGCWAEDEDSFTVLAPISLTLAIISPLDCVSQVTLEATAAGGDGDYTYTWYVDGAPVLVDPQPGGGPSQYTLVFPDDEYCGARTVSVHVQDSRGCENLPPDPSKTLTKVTGIAAS